MTIVAVTGTNGKTTTVALIRHLLNARGAVGSIGTLGAFDGMGRQLEGHGTLTTPGVVELQSVLAELRDCGVTTVALEASSHALDQRRLESLVLHAAVYTNLTHDHLDYHPTLEAYRAAKARLSAQLGPNGIEVVNRDDPAWAGLEQRPGIRRVHYGNDPATDVRVLEAELDAEGASVTFGFGDVRLPARVPLPGAFNVTNALAAVAAVWALGVPPADLVARLATMPQVPGRMERLVADAFVIVRDYAHTPDALERAMSALAPLTTGRLIVLFGAGGDRDRAKRPLMGRAAAQGADLAIVTSDNPRTEDPDRIIEEIEAGMGGVSHLSVTDRREAIQRAVELLRPGDYLLLAGKGHETYQVVGTERVPFDEREIVVAALAARADT